MSHLGHHLHHHGHPMEIGLLRPTTGHLHHHLLSATPLPTTSPTSLTHIKTRHQLSSIKQGTICQFCFSHEAATHIPDPFTAPICDRCDDRGTTIGDNAIGEQRIDTLAAMWLITRTPRHGKGLPAIFTDALTWRTISKFMWNTFVTPPHISRADHNLMAAFPYVIPPPEILDYILARLATLRRHRRNGRDTHLTLLDQGGLCENSEL